MASPDQSNARYGMGDNDDDDDEMDEDIKDDDDDDQASVGEPEEGSTSKKEGAEESEVAPEKAAEDIVADSRTRAQYTIVIQPGSDMLRVGRATDSEPTLVPHAIAKLWKDGYRPTSSVLELSLNDEAEVRERQKEVAEVERSMKRWSAPTRKGTGGGAGVGDGAEEEILAAPPDLFEFVAQGEEEGKSFYCGEEALRVWCVQRPDGAQYVLQRPMRRGRLDLRGRTREEALNDLQRVWEHALLNVLQIPPKELPLYACVLVVPANACKADIKSLVTLVLGRLALRSCAVMQDAACAAFGANAVTACVVDIGEGKTSVSVVEEGSCIACSCHLLGFGGEDIGRLLLWLLQRGGTSSTASKPGASMGAGEHADGVAKLVLGDLDPREPAHVEAFKAFKERACYVLSAQEDLAAATHELSLHRLYGPSTLHRVRLGAAACIAPMGLFNPKLFGPLDWSAAERKPWGDAEEVVDEEFIVEMLQNRPGGGVSPHDDKLVLREEHLLPESGAAPAALHEVVRDAIARAANLHPNTKPEGEKLKEGAKDVSKREEVLSKLYANVILCGASAHIKGLAEAMETRLNKTKPAGVQHASVLVNPKDRHSASLAWSGACIVANVECYKEIFVRQEEWHARGVQVLRERVCFPW